MQDKNHLPSLRKINRHSFRQPYDGTVNTGSPINNQRWPARLTWWRISGLSLVVLAVIIGVVALTPGLRYAVLSKLVSKSVGVVVVDQKTGLPVNNATIQLGNHTVISDASGFAQFVGISIGSHEIKAVRSGYVSQHWSIDLLKLSSIRPLILHLSAVGLQGLNRSSSTNGFLQGGSCNPSGVTKNQDGSFIFASLSVNSQGIVVDAHNCIVYLLGGEGKDAGAGSDQTSEYGVSSVGDFAYAARLIKLEPTMNLIRIPIYDAAWTKNSIVQNTIGAGSPGLTYQQFVEAYIKAMEKYGLYVEVDNYSQNSDNRNDFPDVSTGVTTLSQLAAYFKNDPAVLYDVRNESPHYSQYDRDTILSQDLQLLSAVQKADPSALKVVYDDYMDYMVAHPKSFYVSAGSISNLIMDQHLYSGQYGVGRKIGDPPQWGCLDPNSSNSGNGYWPIEISHYTSSVIPFLHTNHTSLIFNEWGGNCNWFGYNTAMTDSVIDNHLAGLSYFYPLESWEANTYHNIDGLNPIGYNNALLVNNAYTNILSGTRVLNASY